MTIPLFEDFGQQKTGFRRLGAGLLTVFLLYAAGSWGLSAFFNHCLSVYYCLEPADVLCIGHSMSEMGIDKTQLEKSLNRPVAKYCMNGAGPVERLVMLKHYLEAVKTPPKILVYDVSARTFSSGLARESYQLFLPFLNHSNVCTAFIRKNVTDPEFVFLTLSPLSRYENTRLGAVQRGLARNWKTRKNTKFDPELFRQQVAKGEFWHISQVAEAVEAFEETLKLCRENGIRVFLAALPCVDILNDAEPEQYEQIMSFLKKHCDEDGNVVLYDFNPAFSRRYELFADPIHLNPQGQSAVTDTLGRALLETVLK